MFTLGERGLWTSQRRRKYTYRKKNKNQRLFLLNSVSLKFRQLATSVKLLKVHLFSFKKRRSLAYTSISVLNNKQTKFQHSMSPLMKNWVQTTEQRKKRSIRISTTEEKNLLKVQIRKYSTYSSPSHTHFHISSYLFSSNDDKLVKLNRKINRLYFEYGQKAFDFGGNYTKALMWS